MSRHGSWKRLWLSGLASSAAVAGTAALRSQVEGRSIWKPINAVSHIVWGWHAATRRELSVRYTGTGLILNLVACAFWAACYEAWRRAMPRPHSPSTAAMIGVGTSVLAYITDYHVVPRRLTPGFELSLSRHSFPWIYSALAIGLILPNWLNSERTGGHDKSKTNLSLSFSRTRQLGMDTGEVTTYARDEQCR